MTSSTRAKLVISIAWVRTTTPAKTAKTVADNFQWLLDHATKLEAENEKMITVQKLVQVLDQKLTDSETARKAAEKTIAEFPTPPAPEKVMSDADVAEVVALQAKLNLKDDGTPNA